MISDGLITLADTKVVIARSRRMGDTTARPFRFQENLNDRMINILGPANAAQFVVENDAVGVFLKLVGNAGFGLPSHAALLTFI